jgi:RNA-directed DNA polymerase
VKNITNRIFICHKQVNNDTKSNSYSPKRQQNYFCNGTVKRLCYLLTHSFYPKLLAIRKVIQNKGKRTAGIDGECWKTPEAKMKAALKLSGKRYKSKPLKRVYIEKYGKSKKRPLGIPTMYDRAMQSLYALALSPIAETTADKHSFGFRKFRSTHDACEQIFVCMSRKESAQWTLEGDIKGCFDNISHQWLLDNIPMDKSVLKQFLKAGFVFNHTLFPTEAGTPQGGLVRRESYTMDCGQPVILSIQNVPTLMCICGNGFVQSSEDNEV